MADSIHDDASANPYRAPDPEHASSERSSEAWAPDANSPEAIRQACIAHETSVRAIGLLLYVRSAFAVIQILVVWLMLGRQEMVAVTVGRELRLSQNVVAGLFVVTVAIALFNVYLGAQLRQLRGWARWTLIVLNSLAMFRQGQAVGLVFQFGISLPVIYTLMYMLVNIYVIYILLVSGDATVFLPEYHTVISLTSEVKGELGLRDYLMLVATAAVDMATLSRVVGLF